MIFPSHKTQRSLRVLLVLLTALALPAGPWLWGQTKQVQHRLYRAAGPGTYAFISSEFSFNGKVVTDAPYSAEAVTVTSQTLVDGNRIRRTVSSRVYRDSQGRTRQEHSLGALGPWAAGGPERSIITIHDPVNAQTLTLDPEARTARRMPRRGFDVHRLGDSGRGVVVGARSLHEMESHESIHIEGGDRTAAISIRKLRISDPEQDDEDVRTEELGSRSFGNVLAEGTRTITTIPAGAIGNELPIEVVSERWYSEDLHIAVMSRRYDPRFGETVYELRDLSQAEPDPSLFEVPEDYTEGGFTPAGTEFHFESESGARTKVKP